MSRVQTIHPCDECPFSQDGIKRLGKDRAEAILEGIKCGNRFACHKTLPLGEDGLGNAGGQGCRGAIRCILGMSGVVNEAEFVREQSKV